MKTSEFIKKWNNDHNDKARRIGDNAVKVCSGPTEVLYIEDDSVIFHMPNESFMDDEIMLINSYLSTKPENRKDERKWVIPWGNRVDGSETISAWRRATGPYISTMSDHRWRSDKSYWFTDSEIEMLKDVQSPAIAQAIDMAKELVSDE